MIGDLITQLGNDHCPGVKYHEHKSQNMIIAPGVNKIPDTDHHGTAPIHDNVEGKPIPFPGNIPVISNSSVKGIPKPV